MDIKLENMSYQEFKGGIVMSPLDWFCIGYIIVSVIVMIIYFITDGDFVCLIFAAIIIIITMFNIAVYKGWF